MKIRFQNMAHFTQFVFWLDIMMQTEFFSIATFIGAILFYGMLHLRFKVG